MNYAVHIGSFNNHQTQEWTQEQFLQEIDAGLSIIQGLINTCEVAYQAGYSTKQPYWWGRGTRPLSGIKNMGLITLHYECPPLNWVNVILADLRHLQDECQKCQSQIKRNLAPTYFGVQSTIDPQQVVASLQMIRAADAGCPKCGVWLRASSLKRHINSPSCLHRVGQRAADDQKWVKITDATTLRALTEASIEHETRPIVFATWAPRWVQDAANQFKRNKGFAGMTMKQYLLKMKNISNG